jgi:predicted regulator of Ras-like GTPase activity (Roadblock/LC7/MglB family)
MYCKNCGAELQNPDQTYCPSCGIPLRLKVFKYSVQESKFKPFKIKIPLYEVLDSDYIILFIDSKHSRVWNWYGSNTTTRMKFIASKSAFTIRDKYGKGFKIVAIDEGSEPLEFKFLIGLERESVNQDLMKVCKRLEDNQTSEGHKEISGIIICDSSGHLIDSNFDIELSEETTAYIPSLIGKARQVVEALKEGELKSIRLETAKNTEIMIALEENLIIIILKGGSAMRKRASDEGDFPFPYVFKPPKPPDDLALAGEAQSKEPESKQVLVYEIYCKHCGAELPKGQTICHVCGEKVD